MSVLITLFLTALTAFSPQPVLSGPPGATAPVKTDIRSLGVALSAPSALAVDAASGAVLFAKDSQARRPIASLSKLLAALVFLESQPDLTQSMLMRAEDDREGGEDFIRPGESATLESYLAASLIGSSNNATIVLSRSIGTTAAEFVEKMNAKAQSLGMTDTVIVEPTGLDPENISTARDLVRLLQAAAANQKIRQLTTTWRRYITVYPSQTERPVINTDHLLGSIVPVVLGKTGYLDEALYNLATLVRVRGGQEIYIVILGARTNEDRVQDAKSLAIWAGNTYLWK